MKILFTIDDRYPVSGGSTRVVSQLSAGLLADGHQVAILAPRGSISKYGETIIESPLLHIPFAQEGSLLHSKTAIKKALDFKPDIIHSHSERYALNYAQKLAKKSGSPHVHTMHGNYSGIRVYYPMGEVVSIIVYVLSLTAMLRKNRKYVSFKRSMFAKNFWNNLDIRSIEQFAMSADMAITPSDYHYEQVEELARKRTRLIPTGHSEDIVKTKNLSAENTILSVGRVCREKRSITILKAFHIAYNNNPSLRLRIVGSGPHLNRLKNYTKRHNMTNQVTFYGQINDRQKLRNLYEQSDVFMQSSYHFETQGLVFLEAASAGLPIVYCDERLKVGVTTKNSVLTEPTENKIAEGLLASIEREKSWQTMSEVSIEEARKWKFNRTLKQHEDLYKSLILVVK